MRVLLIKPKQIGDSLILTPTIAAINAAYPHAEIWVVVRRGTEAMVALYPGVTRVLLLAGVEKCDRDREDIWRQLKVILTLWSVKFDYVFELSDGHRGRWVALLTRVRRRYSVRTSSPLKRFERRRFSAVSSFDWQTCHRVEKDFYSVSEFLPLHQPVPPLQFSREFTKPWQAGHNLSDFCLVQVGSRQGLNRWHREGWRDVCRAMLECFSNVVVSCGPAEHEKEEAAWLQQELGPRVLSTGGKADWAQMAWLLYRARLYVGPNTAAMHLAAACQCPVVALFGPSIEDHWYPWRVPHRIVTSHEYMPVEDTVERYACVKKRAMSEIEVRDVVAACVELLEETGLKPVRS
jgi:heptosyltransferase-3